MFANKTKTEAIVSVYLIQFILFTVRNNMIVALPVLSSYKAVINNIMIVVLFGLYLYLFTYKFKMKLYKTSLVIVLVSILYWLFSMQIDKNVTGTFFRDTCFYCFTICLIIPEMEEEHTYMEKMSKYSYFLSVFMVFIAIIILQTSNAVGISTYSITFGNAVLVIFCFMFYQYMEKSDNKALICSIICLILLFILSSRTVFYCAVVYLIVKIIQSFSNNKHNALKILIITMGILCIFLWDKIISWLILLSGKYNIRTLNLLLSDQGLYLSGREEIYFEIIESMKKNPFLGSGWGVTFGEHSVVLSVFSNFGILFGSIILIWFLYNYIHEYIKSKENKDARELLLIYGCILFPRILFNGSVWSQEVFMALSIMLLIRKNRRAIYNN